MHAYATLITFEFWRQDDTHHWHQAPYTTEVAHCWSCQANQMHYVWFVISVLHLFWYSGPRKISDSINDVSIHIDWRIKWSSFKILNFGFLPGSIHSKLPESSRKPESIIDNRSPSVFRSHCADIFHMRYTTFTMWFACWGRFQNRKEIWYRSLAENAIKIIF